MRLVLRTSVLNMMRRGRDLWLDRMSMGLFLSALGGHWGSLEAVSPGSFEEGESHGYLRAKTRNAIDDEVGQGWAAELAYSL